MAGGRRGSGQNAIDRLYYEQGLDLAHRVSNHFQIDKKHPLNLFAYTRVSHTNVRRLGDLLLFCVTATELVILFLLTPTFGIADWIYVLQHLVVLGIAFTRPNPTARDYSIASSMAVIIAYEIGRASCRERV